jgi:hypothetical protein
MLLVRLNLSARRRPDALVAVPGYRAELERRWGIAAEITRELRRAAADRGAETTVFLIPSDYQVDPTILREFIDLASVDARRIDPELPNHLAIKALGLRGIQPIDLTQALEAAAAQGDHLHGRVDTHWTARGHEIAARELGRYLLPRLLELR